MQKLLIGQPQAVESIVESVELFEAGLSSPSRPAGVYFLMGPTGTGKTHTVEVLADCLHGSERNVLRIDCGEYQLEHEVAKLIGAPPGYLGHRETQPQISQQKVNAVASERSGLSIILFDEIEKAAPSMRRLLLGVLDNASLKLGDNTSVNFERSLIFFSSNVGTREIHKTMAGGFGFGEVAQNPSLVAKEVGMRELRKSFSPEFINRLDAVIQYKPLGEEEIARILDIEIKRMEDLIGIRLGARAVRLDFTASARKWIIANGVSPMYGARELRRVLRRSVLLQVARNVFNKTVDAGETLTVGVSGGEILVSPRERKDEKAS